MKEYKECKECSGSFVYSSSYPNKIFCSKECRSINYKKNSVVAESCKFIILNRDKFRCIYCGISAITHKDVVLNVDHITPKLNGGEDRAYNLVTACERCNVEKGAIVIDSDVIEDIYKEIRKRNETNNISDMLIIKFSKRAYEKK